MLDEEPLGFSAKAPVGLWNKRLGVETPGVFKALLKAALAVATANAPGAVSAAIDGLFAFKLQGKPLPPPELAWNLIRVALAHAMARLTVEAVQRRGLSLEDRDGLVATLDGALDKVEIPIGRGFFDNPANHPIVGQAQPRFHEWLVSLELSEAEAASVDHRLGAYFTFALHREWVRNAKHYALLEAEIRTWDTPFAKANERERAWLRNAAWLQRQIEEPVFYETFGLAKVYVPLRAWYAEEGRGPSHRRELREEGAEEKRRIVVDLEDALDGWLRTADRKDTIRVICGGPGSGKTSTARMWAARLAAEGRRVLFVPLHRLDYQTGDAQKAFKDFIDDFGILPFDPLDSKEGEPRLLILFDGLDELAMQGRAGQEVARTFIEAVQRRVDRINEQDGRCLQVVFGGRDVVVAAAERLVADHQVFHVLPYHGANPNEYAEGHWLLEDGRYACDRWWQRFGKATGEGYNGLPRPLQNEELADITAQPLLNYLLALSFRRGKVDFSTTPNLNTVYADLLDAVYERRWGPAGHPITKPLTRTEFDDLLDELGLAAWHGDGRTITEAKVESACESAGLQGQLARFQERARAGAISLLAAFYFRQAGKIEGGERTFEFTHKSFGEYLTARRIVRWMGTIHKMREQRQSDRDLGWGAEEALLKWIQSTGPTALDQDLLAFVEREVRLRETAIVEKWRQTFAELFSDQLAHGLPMHKAGLPTFQEMTRQARNAEEALLAAIHTCAAALDNPSAGPEEQKRTEIRWPDQFAARDLLARLEQGRGSSAIAPFCLGRLNLQGADLYAANLDLANLSTSNLEGAILMRANLIEANLERAILRRANLVKANLDMAILSRSNLEGAELIETYLDEAHLAGANLTGANLFGADLARADLARVRGLDQAQGLDEVQSWQGALIERKWVKRLGLDAEKLGLVVVDDMPEDREGQP